MKFCTSLYKASRRHSYWAKCVASPRTTERFPRLPDERAVHGGENGVGRTPVVIPPDGQDRTGDSARIVKRLVARAVVAVRHRAVGHADGRGFSARAFGVEFELFAPEAFDRLFGSPLRVLPLGDAAVPALALVGFRDPAPRPLSRVPASGAREVFREGAAWGLSYA